MYSSLGVEPIKSGESLELGVVSTPDCDFAGRIQALLGRKIPEWQFHIAAALRGETDLLETRFYPGQVDGAPAGNVMTVELFGSLQWPAAMVISYVDTAAPAKAAVLESTGFEREGTLRGFLRTDASPRDVWLYGKITGTGETRRECAAA